MRPSNHQSSACQSPIHQTSTHQSSGQQPSIHQPHMNVLPELNVDSFFYNIISTYEPRFQKIETAFQLSEDILESSHSLFENVHSCLNELRKERDLLNSKLCETIAKNGSLRKKDYHTMMSDILDSFDAKEKETESQFLIFIEAQKGTAQSLKNSLLSIKDIDSKDTNEKIGIIKEQLSQIPKLQEMRKETVMKSFMSFQQMHNKMMDYLEDMLAKGDQILIQDLKKVKDQILKEINPSSKLPEEIN